MTTRLIACHSLVTILLAGLGWGLGGHAQDSLQGNALLKTDILGVFAHPDDETGMASTLAHYALGEGKTIMHAYCTRGEGGGNMVGTHYGPSLGIMRELELRDCLTQLGVRHWYFLEQLDFAYTESIWATLKRWDKEAALERLVRIIRNHRPEIVLTMNPAPRPGQHGHHQAAGVLATEAVRLAADPDAFPLQIQREGIEVWQVRKLYYGGAMGDHQATIESTAVVRDGLTAGQVAGEALSHHRSQGFGRMRGASWLQLPRTFSLVHSTVPFEAEESDLFRGLDVPSEHLTPGLVKPPVSEVPSKSDDVSIRFITRPAIERYMIWAKEQGIQHVSQAFEADLPVVAGEWNEVALELENFGASTADGEFRLKVPRDWMVDPQYVPFTLKPDLNLQMTVRIKPPEGLPEDGAIQLTARYGASETRAEANLHPVPKQKIARVAEGGLDWGSPFWSRVVPITILPEHRVQGESSGLADSSAQIKMAHDRSAFYAQIDVNDDQVVSNIAANDIRGHWRSDSVEFCLDAKGGAEDSFSTYKLGVFPFDATGRVRAARDADANQGPAEETAPGTELYSERTEDGYRLRLKIPFEEVGEGIESGSRLGFNVIVYDGDKADAAPGENINESRIAWAPRSGVQGRPEDWGRIVLE